MEIKCRAWDKICGGYTKATIDVFYNKDGTFGFSGGDRYILELYTTKQDKNGEDLYEGDRVETIEETISQGDLLIQGVIEYSETICAWMIDFPQYGTARMLDCFWDLGVEKIGTIHDEVSE